MRFCGSPMKCLSVSLSAVILLFNCALANAFETNFWHERRKAAKESRQIQAHPLELASLPGASALSDPARILQNLPAPKNSNWPLTISGNVELFV